MLEDRPVVVQARELDRCSEELVEAVMLKRERDQKDDREQNASITSNAGASSR
jgi:hypothetical protein